MTVASAKRAAMLKLIEERHAHQTRNGRAKTPYAEHCVGAAKVLEEALAMEHGKDAIIVEQLLLATLGHDLYEDGKPTVSRDSIAADYGEEVAALIEEVTNRKDDLDREDYLAHLRTAPEKAMLIKYADQIDNVESVAAHFDHFEPVEVALIIRMLTENFAVLNAYKFGNEWALAANSLRDRLDLAMRKLPQASQEGIRHRR